MRSTLLFVCCKHFAYTVRYSYCFYASIGPCAHAVHPQVSISERVHALEDHVAECEKTMGIKVKDLRDLNDALANKQAEYAKYEAAADKKSQELQGTIDTTVCFYSSGRPRHQHRWCHRIDFYYSLTVVRTPC